MVDEDFVMGYACGYNDGIGSGGGGGDVPTGDTVIYNDVTIAKQWNLTGTPFAIALFDVHSPRLVCGVHSTRYEKTVSGNTHKWDKLVVNYWEAIGLLHNEKIVTVVPIRSVNEYLALNGIPQSGTFIEFKETSGTAELTHSATENSDGSVTHGFSVEITHRVIMSNKTYKNFEMVYESETIGGSGSISPIMWKLNISAGGDKQITYFDPYWLFEPKETTNNSNLYVRKGLLGVPKNTSMQQLFQTGILAETLKESLLNAGESITLEEV